MSSQVLEHYNTIMDNGVRKEKFEVTLSTGAIIIGVPFMGSTSKPLPDQEFFLNTGGGVLHFKFGEIIEISKA